MRAPLALLVLLAVGGCAGFRPVADVLELPDRPEAVAHRAGGLGERDSVRYVVHVSVDGLRPDAVERLPSPAFTRLRLEGAWTHNARTDADYRNTLPNHTAQLTSRPVLGEDGHGWTVNVDPAPGATIHSNRGRYVPSVFDVVHDHGLATAAYVSKSKFSLFDVSYGPAHGAPDTTGADDGRDKIDTFVYDPDTDDLVDRLVAQLESDPAAYTFVHLRDPDAAGHIFRWSLRRGSRYLGAVEDADRLVGRVLEAVERTPRLAGRTAVVVTADHGGSGRHHLAERETHYTVPFYVWSPGVPRADLYELNQGLRADPGDDNVGFDAEPQPIRNGNAANLSLAFLGLPPSRARRSAPPSRSASGPTCRSPWTRRTPPPARPATRCAPDAERRTRSAGRLRPRANGSAGRSPEAGLSTPLSTLCTPPIAAGRAAPYVDRSPPRTMADAVPALSDLLREARHLLGVQREIVGPVRFLGGLPAEEGSGEGERGKGQSAPDLESGQTGAADAALDLEDAAEDTSLDLGDALLDLDEAADLEDALDAQAAVQETTLPALEAEPSDPDSHAGAADLEADSEGAPMTDAVMADSTGIETAALEDDFEPLTAESGAALEDDEPDDSEAAVALEDATSRPDPSAPPSLRPSRSALESRQAGAANGPAPADTPEPAAPAAVDSGPPPSDDVPDLFGALPDPSLDESLSPYERIEALIPDDHPLHGMTSLDEVYAWLSETELVPIDRDRINPVLGTGDPDADLMVIGEAPGADEDRQGVPFVGRSGQLLDKILEAVLFKREEVYICNILKSRPPNNRDPLPEEVEAHIPVLYKQIALVRPKVLLAVGKSAGNGLLGKKSSLASLRGTFQDFYGLPLLVTYHPAALLRNPQWKRPTWEDVKLLRTRYDQLTGA